MHKWMRKKTHPMARVEFSRFLVNVHATIQIVSAVEQKLQHHFTALKNTKTPKLFS